MSRDLRWDGGYNVRDLGGLPTTDGRQVRWGAVVRSASPSFLTEQGWAQLWAHGVRTTIDLTSGGELLAELAPRPAGLVNRQIPLDPVHDTEFWGYWGNGLHGTALYVRPFLDRFPEHTAAVVKAIAHAEPGGVLVHCSAGRDRTGIIALVLLAFAGVAAEEVVADHDLSHARLRPLLARLGRPDHEPAIDEVLARHGTTKREALHAALDGFDPEAHLRAGGCTDADLAALRERLLAPPA
ncbi:tyrosine-protein phosphatase [Saccharopolyspora sp. NPDC000359]|uniref:tyrosine-protein phosphatase n=1 Tax=Saccharopolyspora sp. NPDC000359 TaxID=3154251 RepID=UPI0033294C3D